MRIIKRLAKICGILGLTFVFSVAYNMHLYRYGLNDAFFRTLFSPLEFTIWKEGFSEENFSKIQLGMTEDQVLSLVGEPIFSYCVETCEWLYTRQETDVDSFDRRAVAFDQNKRVEMIRKEFWVD